MQSGQKRAVTDRSVEREGQSESSNDQEEEVNIKIKTKVSFKQNWETIQNERRKLLEGHYNSSPCLWCHVSTDGKAVNEVI